jgi:hypothetical protein
MWIVRGAACAGVALAAPLATRAASQVDESDETAIALGYKHDTHKVDKKRYSNHADAQRCSNCSFFQGAASDEWAGCAMFGRKHIAAAGWCNAWAKKPG